MIKLEMVVSVLLLLTIGTLVTCLRAFGHMAYFKDKDPLAGGTKQEKLRNWALMATLFWATMIPFFVAFPLLMQLGEWLAVSSGIQTEGKNANVPYAMGYLFVIALPLSALGSLLGKLAWKAIAGTYISKMLLTKVLDDKWWKRAAGD